MSKMFKTITRTWNPFTGCGFDCSYCWAKKLAEGKLKDTPRYRDNGFRPACHPEELKAKFKPGEFVFVSSMGDIAFCSIDFMREITAVIRANPQTNFLLQSKSPGQFNTRGEIPENVYLGTTLETNRVYDRNYISMAPSPPARARTIMFNLHPHKFISIEPVMDFDVIEFSKMVIDINPEIVEIGADNYHNNLPEPSWEKVSRIISILTLHGVKVIEKDGLRRKFHTPRNLEKELKSE